jgi:hypothetical protein
MAAASFTTALQRRVIMNRIRLVSLVAAALITATQWAPLIGSLPCVPSLRLVAMRAGGDVTGRTQPLIGAAVLQRSHGAG